MYLTVKNQLRNLSIEYFETLYYVRRYYFAEHKYLKYESNYHECKGSENYKALGTDVAQQTMKVVDGIFKSFYALILLKREHGELRFNIPPKLEGKKICEVRIHPVDDSRRQTIKELQSLV